MLASPWMLCMGSEAAPLCCWLSSELICPVAERFSSGFVPSHKTCDPSPANSTHSCNSADSTASLGDNAVCHNPQRSFQHATCIRKMYRQLFIHLGKGEIKFIHSGEGALTASLENRLKQPAVPALLC
jgi:hypothetical protein